jgi:hypothetical protein
VGKTEGKRPLRRIKYMRNHNITIEDEVVRTELMWLKVGTSGGEHGNETSGSKKCCNFWSSCATIHFLKGTQDLANVSVEIFRGYFEKKISTGLFI